MSEDNVRIIRKKTIWISKGDWQELKRRVKGCNLEGGPGEIAGAIIREYLAEGNLLEFDEEATP